jgi:branched-chain amino acid transport system permease protein
VDQGALLIVNGLSWAMLLFLAASGLTLVFGILHVLNFSHGGFLMIGAYLAYAILGRLQTPSFAAFVATALLCGFSLAAIGLVVDRVVLKRLKAVGEAYSLIATYALLLLCQGVVKIIWGIDFLSVPPPTGLAGATSVLGVRAPSFVFFAIFVGIAVFLVMDHALRRTGLGKIVQSVAMDPWMSGVLGVNVNAVFAATVAIGFGLAGAVGAILSLNQSLAPEMGTSMIIQAFGVIIVGGLGNVRGAFISAVVLGLVTAVGDRVVPDIPGLFFYLALIAILLLRPQGLMRGLR